MMDPGEAMWHSYPRVEPMGGVKLGASPPAGSFSPLTVFFLRFGRPQAQMGRLPAVPGRTHLSERKLLCRVGVNDQHRAVG